MKTLLVLAIGLLTFSCGKKCVTCKEKTYMYTTHENLKKGDFGNGDSHTYCEGESVMNQDGTLEKLTKESIEKKVKDYEATGLYDCK
jgi:hypothetical protein